MPVPEPEWKRWYWTARWKRRRHEQLSEHPLCWRCAEEGTVTRATVANHTIRHRGDPEIFWNGPLDSQCKRHHDSDQQREERSGRIVQAVGVDGWPAPTPPSRAKPKRSVEPDR